MTADWYLIAALGMAHPATISVSRVTMSAMAGDVLHERDGAHAYERDGHRVGAHAVACDAVGGVEHHLADEHKVKLGARRHHARDVDRPRPGRRLLADPWLDASPGWR